MAITIKREGYGYIEPNFLSAPRTGQVRADLPAAEGIEVLMNGMFVKRHGNFEGAKTDWENNNVSFEGDGQWWLVFNEEKLYDERHQMHRDFAMTPDQFYDGRMVPRILLPLLGDTFTTNCIAGAETEEGVVVELGDKFAPNADGILEKGAGEMYVATLLYTMPDGQPGVKLEYIGQ